MVHRPPPLSVVVPTRDTRELTLACLESLHSCERPLPAIVLVDDGSRDGTGEAVRAAFPAVQILRNEEPRGFGAAANRGLAASRGDLLLVLNSDTEVDRGGLPKLIEAFEQSPSLGIAGAELRNPDGSPQWGGGPEPTLLWLFALTSGLAMGLSRLPGYRRLRPPRGSSPNESVAWVSGAAMAFRRSVWEGAGRLDEGYQFYVQDLDLCLRARAAGWRVEIARGFRVIHHGGSTVSRVGDGTCDRQQLLLLWSDLHRWAHDWRGARWARRAALVMSVGARTRILLRRATIWRGAASDRAHARRQIAEWEDALRALRARRLAAARPHGGPLPGPIASRRSRSSSG